MSRRLFSTVVVLMLLTPLAVFAAKKDELKAQREAKGELIKYRNETLKPMMNCMMQGLNNLQKMIPEETIRNQEAVNAVKGCVDQFPATVADAAGAQLKADIAAKLLDIHRYGNEYVAAQKEYDALRLTMEDAKKKKQRDKLQPQLDAALARLDAKKREIMPFLDQYKALGKRLDDWVAAIKAEVAEIDKQLRK